MNDDKLKDDLLEFHIKPEFEQEVKKRLVIPKTSLSYKVYNLVYKRTLGKMPETVQKSFHVLMKLLTYCWIVLLLFECFKYLLAIPIGIGPLSRATFGKGALLTIVSLMVIFGYNRIEKDYLAFIAKEYKNNKARGEAISDEIMLTTRNTTVLACLSTLIFLFSAFSAIIKHLMITAMGNPNFSKSFSTMFWTKLYNHPLWGIVFMTGAVIFTYARFYQINKVELLKFNVVITDWGARYNDVPEHAKKLFYSKDLTEIPLGYPIIPIGYDRKTGNIVVIHGDEMTTGSYFSGNPGAGKTEAQIKTIAMYYAKCMAYSIIRFGQMVEKKGIAGNFEEISKHWFTKEYSRWASISLLVGDPSGSLTDDLYEALQKVGYPMELIHYINPENIDTDSPYIFEGEKEAVSQTFSDVFANMKSGNTATTNEYFIILARNKLQAHMNLLLYGSTHSDITSADLQRVMMEPKVKFKAFAQIEMRMNELEKELATEEHQMPKEESEKKLRLLGIYKSTYFYFKNETQYQITFDPNGTGQLVEAPGSKFSTDSASLDAKVNNLFSPQGIQRVLFKKGTFSIPHQLKYGGITLLNTSRKINGDNAADNLGKLITAYYFSNIDKLNPKTQGYNTILADEAPGYSSARYFPKAIEEQRKYQLVFMAWSQNLARFRAEIGDDAADRLFKAGTIGTYSYPGEDELKLWMTSFGMHKGINATTTTLKNDFDLTEKASMLIKDIENVSQSDLQSLEGFNYILKTRKGMDIELVTEVAAVPFFMQDVDSFHVDIPDNYRQWFLDFWNWGKTQDYTKDESDKSVKADARVEVVDNSNGQFSTTPIPEGTYVPNGEETTTETSEQAQQLTPPTETLKREPNSWRKLARELIHPPKKHKKGENASSVSSTSTASATPSPSNQVDATSETASVTGVNIPSDGNRKDETSAEKETTTAPNQNIENKGSSDGPAQFPTASSIKQSAKKMVWDAVSRDIKLQEVENSSTSGSASNSGTKEPVKTNNSKGSSNTAERPKYAKSSSGFESKSFRQTPSWYDEISGDDEVRLK